jgi:hypothetical protein
MRSWIMRTHAAYSPIAEDIITLFEKAKAGAMSLAS